jgi:prepilin-type N-terminal cleavage/methylation domain-containing protein
MTVFRRGFTLIELLVVIAIIAILAAILFPVFAQAKLAAKKTASLSQTKQMASATHIYLSDHDDRYPLGFGQDPYFGFYGYNWVHDVPADLNSPMYADYVDMFGSSWANSTHPYTKSYAMLAAPSVKDRDLFSEGYSSNPRAAKIGLTYNGLLHGYSGSAIVSPSSVMLYTMANGNENYYAYAVANPYLICEDSSQGCSYTPTNSSCSFAANGSTSALYSPVDASMWVFGNGMNVAMADSSAKFRKLGMNIEGKTDFKTDFYSQYDKAGIPGAQWRDEFNCHSILFRPDFDFSTWGSPLEVLD